MKSIITSILIACFFVSYSQNTPGFKMNENPTFGKTFTKTDKGVYITVNSLAVEQLDKEILAKEAAYTTLIDAIDFTPGPLSDKEVLDEKEKQKLLLSEINTLKERRDFFRNEYIKEFIEYRPYVLGYWMERSKAFFEILYNTGNERFNWLNSTGFNLGNSTGAIYSEIASGHLYIFRVSLGAMIASNSDEDQETAELNEAYQRLVTYGGNTVLKLEYPILYAHAPNNQLTCVARLVGKGTYDFPQFGTKSENSAGSGSYGIDVYGDISTSNNKLRFFANFNLNKIYGTKSYLDNLGIDNSNFTFGQLKLGLIFNRNISLSFVVATFSSESSLENRAIIAGGQILPE
jgi:hypothetical protein